MIITCIKRLISIQNYGEPHYSIKEINPDSQIPALFDKEITISLSESDNDVTQIQNSFLSIVLASNQKFDIKFEQFDDSYKDEVKTFVGLKSGSNIIREYTVYLRGRTIDGSLQNDATTESFIYNTIKPKLEKNNRKHIHFLHENIHKFDTQACGTYITMRDNEKAIGTQTNNTYLMPVRFGIQVPLDDMLIFSAFTDNNYGLFKDLKNKFKINHNAFVFAQVNPAVSLAKFYTMNQDELLSSGKQKLMDNDLFFRNWSLTFQYTKQFTQFGCTAHLITSFRTVQLTPSGLKNLVYNIGPVTVSLKNYVVTEITANMASYKATDACLARVRDFFSSTIFVIPAQKVEI
ncbi:MAG: hypothetical protein EZS28_016453 [Streblomastix strix]|uniref:Uncharacterized protein n=1 Tax=Streblomastix strix TaxID=222440 RepID=A0A5J4VZM2_9EUKA|nr:MAG: hypothetical protein EZS28_016453 [Streblomastix strix]